LTGLGLSNPITYDTLETLTLTLGAGDDNFSIQSTHAGQTNLNSHAGNDTINVFAISGPTHIDTGLDDDILTIGSPTHGTADLDADLTLTASLGNDALTIDYSGDTAGLTGSLTRNTLTGLNMTGTLSYDTFETLTLNLGAGDDNFSIRSTHDGATNLFAGAGMNTVTIGSAATSLGGLLDNIAGLLTITGGTASDILILDDSADTTNNTGALTSTMLTGLGMTGQIVYADIDDLQLLLGAGDDTFTIESTHDASTMLRTADGNDTILVKTTAGHTTIESGDDDDTITVGTHDSDTLETIAADLTISGQSGNDTLNIDGETMAANAGNGAQATLTSNAFTADRMPGDISYDTLEQLELTLGAGADNVTIQSTTPAKPSSTPTPATIPSMSSSSQATP